MCVGCSERTDKGYGHDGGDCHLNLHAGDEADADAAHDLAEEEATAYCALWNVRICAGDGQKRSLQITIQFP